MLIVPLEEAQPGMKLAADVLHPAQPDQALLRQGFVLDAPVLRRLHELGILAIYVDYPDLAELDRQLAPCLSPARLRIFSQVKATVNAVRGAARPTVGFADYYATIREFTITLFQQGEHPVYLEQIATRLGEDGVAHASAVAHLALLLGIRLQSYLLEQRSRLPARHAAEIVNLGIAGMLHDIGKSRLPAELVHHSDSVRPENPDQRAMWETHCQLGYDLIRGGVESSAAAAVLQHHQHFDGSGFPKLTNHHGQPIEMAEGRIHVFARILAVADLFDHLVHPGPGAHRPNVEALHLLRKNHQAWLDPRVTDALAQVVPPFPPGAKVRLSDGTMAVVTALGQDPYRPIIRRLAEDGWTLSNEPVNLSAGGGVQIDSIDGVAVAGMIPPSPAKARVREPRGAAMV